MQKVKSPTAKKLDKTKDAVDYGFQRVKEWTAKELSDLQKNSKTPICIELSNGDYQVATYRVVKISSVCWAADDREFHDKRSAIFYCTLLYLEHFVEAYELEATDTAVSRLDSDKALFRVRLDKAHEVGDQFKIDLYSSRFDETKRRLAHAKQELEKIINKAKYLTRL